MTLDQLMKLDGKALRDACRALPETTRARLQGESSARMAMAKAAIAQIEAAIRAVYAECAAKPSTIAAAAEVGCTPEEMAVRILGPMSTGASRQSNFVEDEDNPAIRQLREALK